ncbi:hypothetical protein SAMN05421823_11948 [Catalinimonas alkaloidigena]|uniref:Uncharacterized protein n=1 Tax=Catalinimonas alkaloidigena TaxID=1075417 RepID=A0A1G9V8I3_9BACT|nr:hypothetical protein [Catalinimonas alkaloidigena]SDM68366.1 hypothetical protein SAMN05421823_11948 [Catalinimonas alkaloidigena]
MLYEVGKPFPDERFRHHGQGAVVTFHQAGFDVIGLMDRPTSEEVKTWKKGKLRYGLHVVEAIPFFILDFRWPLPFSLDAPSNAFKVQGIDQWSIGQGNLTNLFLIDRTTYKLQAMRAIGIEPSLAQSFRTALLTQRDSYGSLQAVDRKTTELYQRYSTEDMIQKTRMHTL